MALNHVIVSTNFPVAIEIAYQNYQNLVSLTVSVPGDRPNNTLLDTSDEVNTVFIGTASQDCPDAAAWTAPEIAGYTFIGWYTLVENLSYSLIPKADFQSRIASGRTTSWGVLKNAMKYWRTSPNSYDFLLRAVYDPITVQVEFNANMGSVAPASQAATFGIPFVFPSSSPTRERYRFLGWSDDRNAATGTYQPSQSVSFPASMFASGTVTLYAIWQYCAVVALLNAQGGSVSTRYLIAETGKQYGVLPTPTRAGFTFDGWFTSSSGGTQVTSSTVCDETDRHTLYAHWTASGAPSGVYHAVTLNPCGGTVSPTTVTVEEGSAYGSLPNPQRVGHAFAGWYTHPTDGTVVTSATPVTSDEDHVLYARWTATTIILTFDANGGTCSQQTKTVSYGKAVGILPAATKSDKVFAGWYTALSQGTQVKATTRLTSSTTLYAIWQDPLQDGGTALWIF